MNKNRHKSPVYKNLLKTRKNVVNDPKIFGFKKKKWSKFKFFARKKLKFFKRYRLHDQSKYVMSRFASRGNSFSQQFRNYLTQLKAIKIIYGLKRKKHARKALLVSRPNRKKNFTNSSFTLVFERRLDRVLCQSKFCTTIKQAQQMILHGHFRVNGGKVSSHDCLVKHGDQITVADSKVSRGVVLDNVLTSNLWPLPPKFLKVGYSTLTIIVVLKDHNFEPFFLPFKSRLSLLRNLARFK